MRRTLHVALADFRQRIRSRRLLVVLAAVAYLGYLVNVGTIELAYQQPIEGTGDYTTFYGEPTAAFIGLKAAVTGTSVVYFGGYYLFTGTLTRDRRLGVDQLAASTPVSTHAYLLGKWLSHVALICVLLCTLGTATVVNHVVSGVGPTDPVAIFIPILLFGIPLGAFVAGIAVLFESSDWLDGTLGNISYFFLAIVGFSVLGLTLGRAPSDVSLWAKAGDLLGLLTVYEMTFDALRQVIPAYSGGPPSFGQIYTDSSSTYHYTGSHIPAWVFGHRLGIFVIGAAVTVLASVPFDRWSSSGPDQRSLVARLLSRLPSLRTNGADETTELDPSEFSTTPVTGRNAASVVKLTWLELRMLLRGQRWWWYLGAVGLVAAGLFGSGTPRHALVSVALVWPLFLWSSIGVRPFKHRTRAFIISSGSPYRQLFAEWLSGVLVTLVIVGPAMVTTGPYDQTIAALAGVALFVPSVALAMGIWSTSSTPFELGYLVLWYIGPVNAVPEFDFAGVTETALNTGTPLIFGAVGLIALVAAVLHRHCASRHRSLPVLGYR